MAQRAGRDVQAFVIYAEIPHTLFITVPMDWTVGSLKKRVNNEMKSHMNGLLPGIQLDSETCDIFPVPPGDTTTMQELGTKQLTMIVWPQKRNGHNPSHLREAILSPLLGIGSSGQNTGTSTKQRNKVYNVTTSKECGTLAAELLEHLRNSSDPVGAAILEKLYYRIAEVQHTIEEQAKKLEEQAKKLEEQEKKLEEIALRIKQLKQQIEGLNEKYMREINELKQQINELTQRDNKQKQMVEGLQHEIAKWTAWKNRLVLSREGQVNLAPRAKREKWTLGPDDRKTAPGVTENNSPGGNPPLFETKQSEMLEWKHGVLLSLPMVRRIFLPMRSSRLVSMVSFR